MFFKTFRKIKAVFYSPKTEASIPVALVKLLKSSGKFKAQWYLQQYPDVAESKYWRENPEAHYLLFGAELGYNPCSWFETNWYLATYPDVQQAVVNPFVHYILHGISEGRLPNPRKSKKLSGKSNKSYSDIRDRLANHLWGGLSGSALIALEQAYNDINLPANERWSACWHASRWYYFIGNYAMALQLGNLLLELDPAQRLRKEGVLLRAFCLNELARHNDAKAELQNYLEQHQDDADGYFALANCCVDNDDFRLQLINKAFAIHGFAPISLINKTIPLSISNITCETPATTDGRYKISIIMPVYNAEAHLHIAVNSLLNQTWQNIEIIIVDDCSSDSTFQCATALAKEDKRVVALRQNENAGAYAARNRGLTVATGDFITTHDSDDWSHPQKLESQIAYFEKHPKAMGICTHWIRVRPNMQFTQNWRPNNALTHWSQSSFMFKRQVVEELGGWDEVRVGGDTEFIWRVKAKYGQQGYAQIIKDIPLAFALDDQNSLTRTKATHVKTVYFGLRNIYREICAWWHRTSKELHIEHPRSRKSFRIPVAMEFRDGRSTKVDVLLISDFSNDDMSESCFKLVTEHPQLKFGLMHWPNFALPPGKLTQYYFETLAFKGAIPVAAGEQLITDHVVYASEILIEHPVDTTPELLQPAKCWLLNTTQPRQSHYSSIFGGEINVISETDFKKQLLQ